jgi:processing peptidase subunit beta
VIAASGAVKHEDFVEQVKKLFTKLSTNPTTASQLVEKEPAIFTGSEVSMLILILSIFENRFQCS